jgi:choline transport protein
MTAIISWTSVVCIGASAAAGMTNNIFAMVSITRPGFVTERWMVFLVYQACVWSSALTVLYEKAVPILSNGFTLLSLFTVLATVICLLAPSSEKQSAAVVFGARDYFNISGWPDGVAFLIGISSVNWGFSCLDACTHVAEELPNPRKDIPKALLWTVAIALVTGLLTNLAIFLAANDLENTTSILGLLYDVFNGNPTCAIAIGAFITVSVWGSVIGIHTWHSRIAWSLSRDKGFPFHSFLSQLAPAPFHTPAWAVLWGTAWMAICGFLILASTTAFNSFISAGIVLQYMTYAICAILLLLKGRNSIPRSPFWWPKFGPIANIVVICWTLLITVVYSFPYFLPVAAGSMNYLAVVLFIAFLYAGAYWVLYGNNHYRLVSLDLVLG